MSIELQQSKQNGSALGEKPVSERVKFFQYLAEEILFVDFSYANAATFRAVAERCRSVVQGRPHASIRTLVDVSGTSFDKEVIQVAADLAKHNRPYVVRSAVIGVTGLRQIAFSAVAKLSGRDMRLFNSRDDAVSWVIGHD